MGGWRGHGLRLAGCAILGGAAFALARVFLPGEVATVIGWDAGSIAYAARVWATLAPVSAKAISAWSAREDEGRGALTLLLTAAVGASFVAIFDMVSARSGGLELALAALTIAVSFAMLHTAFAAHYAHRCFAGGKDEPGLDFPGGSPRFVDFAYYSFTIGMTFQTSDVETRNSDMRALTLVHGVVSFVFNTVIIATSVGLVSGLLGGG